MTSIDTTQLQVAGSVITPDGPGYEEARRVHNGLIDKPAVIARCLGPGHRRCAAAGPGDWAGGLHSGWRAQRRRARGHRSWTDDRPRLDARSARQSEAAQRARPGRRDLARPQSREATPRAGDDRGRDLDDRDRGAHPGRRARLVDERVGLAADNLISAELVTAAGDVLNVSGEDHPDLFWALRGGGGNFGVAASLEYRLHPLRQVVGGLVIHPFSAAAQAFRFYRGSGRNCRTT